MLTGDGVNGAVRDRAVMLGMPSNQAKDAIAYTPRAVLLKARECAAVHAETFRH